MRTVSQAAEQVIMGSPFLAEAISEGVGNNAQIARRIKPEVEKLLLEEVSEASIAMALHRLGKNMQRPVYGTEFLKQIKDITVRSDLVQFVFPNSSEALGAFDVVSRAAQRKKEAFFNFSRGLHETLLIVSKDLASTLAEHSKRLQQVESLSAITVRLPEASLSVPGVYHPILKAIALEGISLVEVFSVRTEFSIIFEDKDVDRAFSVIKKITS